PFTGKKLDAENGFEALKMVAKSARKYTGIDCIKNGVVDVQKLKQALESSGKGSLGLISDDNITELEELGDVAKIDTAYKEQDDSGDVQHRQLGEYIDTNNNKYKVDDVWFKSS
ncbi:MAG: hypothetical protein V2B14_01940, partial [bacterium]